MKILPPRTAPPDEPFVRRHSPVPIEYAGGYREFRDCVRWEFGFMCPFCLLHEADFSEVGVDGLGLTAVEHLEPSSLAPDLGNDYANCVYICRLCNTARSNMSSRVDGRRLLDPANDSWADHFESVGDEVRAGVGDDDAAYTATTYDINEPRKTIRRQKRHQTIAECVAAFETTPDLISRLLDRAEKIRQETGQLPQELLDAAHVLQRHLDWAWQDLVRFRAMPQDAPRSCRCAEKPAFELPRTIEKQVIEIDENSKF